MSGFYRSTETRDMRVSMITWPPPARHLCSLMASSHDLTPAWPRGSPAWPFMCPLSPAPPLIQRWKASLIPVGTTVSAPPANSVQVPTVSSLSQLPFPQLSTCRAPVRAMPTRGGCGCVCASRVRAHVPGCWCLREATREISSTKTVCLRVRGIAQQTSEAIKMSFP